MEISMNALFSYFGGYTYALAALLFIMSLVLFLTMGYDKVQARRGGWRVPEKRLFLLAALGGAIGGFFGMVAFRHRTRHTAFVLGFPALALIQAAALVYMAVCL